MHVMRMVGLALTTVTALALATFGAGCGGDDSDDKPTSDGAIDAPVVDAMPDAAEPAPVLRNPLTTADPELAHAALQLLGANVEGARADSCNHCHALTRQQLRYWRALSDTSITDCLTDLAVGSKDSALTMIGCTRTKPASATSDFQTTKLGIYAAAAHLPWFAYTFGRAYGDDAATQLTRFQHLVAMPKDDIVPSFTQPEFDVVAEWFARGLPGLEDELPTDPAPTVCTPGISAAVGAHVTAMATTGWRAVNRQNQLAMYGCGAATDPKDCLADHVLASGQPYGDGWDLPGHGRLRLLKDVGYSSSYWTRSSPDGRFVGHGAQDVDGSYIIDLQRNAQVLVAANYDPGFFPDNSGWMFQGGARNVCTMSVLTTDPNLSTVSMTESGCSRLSTIGLYQHVGQMLGGGDYFAVDSEFVSDDGGHHLTTRNPYASFGSHAEIDFIPMVFGGTTYQARPRVSVSTPFEGDSVISPSAKIVISRVEGPNEDQLGYVLRHVDATRVGSSYDIAYPEIARYCMTGGKPGFSYDERWITYHRYVTAADAVDLGFTGPSDPGFAPYLAKGASNLFLMELSTGVSVRITNMHPGQYALFPHFRSDGWIYADVRDPGAGREYFVASDAALLAE